MSSKRRLTLMRAYIIAGIDRRHRWKEADTGTMLKSSVNEIRYMERHSRWSFDNRSVIYRWSNVIECVEMDYKTENDVREVENI